MTRLLFRDDPYQREAEAVVTGHTAEGGDHSGLHRSSMPPAAGNRATVGICIWEGGKIAIATAVKADGGQIALVAAEPAQMPPSGRRCGRCWTGIADIGIMRVHTALHLLSVVIPLPVTGGQIGAEQGRLDFDMPDAARRYAGAR